MKAKSNQTWAISPSVSIRTLEMTSERACFDLAMLSMKVLGLPPWTLVARGMFGSFRLAL